MLYIIIVIKINELLSMHLFITLCILLLIYSFNCLFSVLYMYYTVFYITCKILQNFTLNFVLRVIDCLKRLNIMSIILSIILYFYYLKNIDPMKY